MGDQLIECPKCGRQNDSAAATCSNCGIGFAWAVEYWSNLVTGPQEYDSPLILIVDDDIGVLTMVGIMLNRAGYRVAKGHDGYEALDLTLRVLPDLIITGVVMPGLSGFDLIQCLKASPTTDKIPVFVLSARDDPDSMQEGIDAGAKVYLTKPVLQTDLIGAVGSLLRSWPVILFVRDEKLGNLSTALFDKHLYALQGQVKNLIDQVKHLKPDVIALAFHLLEADGLDLLVQLKADPDVSHIPVVMLADYPEREHERRARERGAYDVFTGPVDADKLLAMLSPLPSQE